MKYWPVATGQGRDRYACISATTSGDLLREYYAAFYDGADGALLLMQSAFADTVKPEIGKYVFGYRGQEGAVVWMMRIGPKASNEALIQVSHVDNDIDGHIFRCKVKALQEGENPIPP